MPPEPLAIQFPSTCVQLGTTHRCSVPPDSHLEPPDSHLERQQMPHRPTQLSESQIRSARRRMGWRSLAWLTDSHTGGVVARPRTAHRSSWRRMRKCAPARPAAPQASRCGAQPCIARSPPLERMQGHSPAEALHSHGRGREEKAEWRGIDFAAAG